MDALGETRYKQQYYTINKEERNNDSVWRPQIDHDDDDDDIFRTVIIIMMTFHILLLES